MKLLRRLFRLKPKRTKEEALLSLMNAGWFLAMHGTPNEVMLSKSAYASLRKSIANNTLDTAEQLLCAIRDNRIRKMTAVRSPSLGEGAAPAD